MSIHMSRRFMAFGVAALAVAFSGVSQARADHDDWRGRDRNSRQCDRRQDCGPRQRDCDTRNYNSRYSSWNQYGWNQNGWNRDRCEPRYQARYERRDCDSDSWGRSQRNWNRSGRR